jgi:hypothetical protein
LQPPLFASQRIASRERPIIRRNPSELGILEREITRVPHGRAIVIPLSDQTRGHGSHTIAALWKDQLSVLLKESAPKK